MKRDIFSVKNKVVVTTGGSGFLGRQYTTALRTFGAKVVNWDIAEGIDVTDKNALTAAARTTMKKFGRIDVLITAAALNPDAGGSSKEHWAPYEKFSQSLWEKELTVNLSGSHLSIQAVAPYMMKRQSGSIILIASDLALIGPQNSIYDRGKFKDIAYIASKAGVLGLMHAWAAYLGRFEVRVNALAPGGMFHDQSKEFVKRNGKLSLLGRMAQTGEYNGPLIFLASDASSYMTGATLVVDGGRTAW